MKEEIRRLLGIGLRGAIFGALALTASITLGAAWTPPSGTPSAANNASEPLNISSDTQTKTGSLYIGASGGSAALCLNGSCKTSWDAASFGGMYSKNDSGGACYKSNPFTGACSCPTSAPTVAQAAADLDDWSSSGSTRYTIYYCYAL